jgi:glucoamylase
MTYRRYPEDVYDGVGTKPNGGNPWFLATATIAELFYDAAFQLQANGTFDVTDISLPFWSYFAPAAQVSAGTAYPKESNEFQVAVSALEGWGDAFLRRVKFHSPADGRLAEEYDRNDGVITGAADLTWSYASVLTAAFARARLRNETEYISDLANLGF